MLPFHGYGKTPMGPTTSAEPFALDRKVKKPLMEKYRRKRINDSLDSLRDFVLLHDQPRQGAKRQLEKADILERTVECLKKIAPAKSYPKDGQQAYEEGRKESFNDGFSCASRAVFEYFAIAMPPVSSTFAQQQFQLGLINHLRNTMQKNAAYSFQPYPASPKSNESSPSPTNSEEPPARKRPWQPWN